MDRRIIIKQDQNPEKNFFVIRQDVLRIANDRGVPVTEVIDELIEDLENFRSPDYQKKIEEINIVGAMSDNLLNSLKLYVTKMKKNFVGKENKDKKENKTEKMQSEWKHIKELIKQAVIEGKQGTEKDIVESLIADIDSGTFEYEFKGKEKKFILKKLRGMVDEINKKEEAEAEKKRQRDEAANRRETQKRKAETAAEKAMEQIAVIVEREYESGNVENKAKFLSSIRDAITGKTEGIDLGIKMEKGSEKYLVEMIDNTIKTEKDELYFEQVRRFTDDFQFLRVYPEIRGAKHGVSKINKFTDSESYERFCSLRELLQKEYNEEMGIQLLLDSDEIDDADRRILTERKKVVDKENERNRKIREEGIRYQGETR